MGVFRPYLIEHGFERSFLEALIVGLPNPQRGSFNACRAQDSLASVPNLLRYLCKKVCNVIVHHFGGLLGVKKIFISEEELEAADADIEKAEATIVSTPLTRLCRKLLGSELVVYQY